jgi:hypothetical protein
VTHYGADVGEDETRRRLDNRTQILLNLRAGRSVQKDSSQENQLPRARWILLYLFSNLLRQSPLSDGGFTASRRVNKFETFGHY